MGKNRLSQVEICYQNRLKAMTREGLIEETNHFRDYYAFVVCILVIYAIIILGVIWK